MAKPSLKIVGGTAFDIDRAPEGECNVEDSFDRASEYRIRDLRFQSRDHFDEDSLSLREAEGWLVDSETEIDELLGDLTSEREVFFIDYEFTPEGEIWEIKVSHRTLDHVRVRRIDEDGE